MDQRINKFLASSFLFIDISSGTMSLHHNYLSAFTLPAIMAVFVTCALSVPLIEHEYHNYDELTLALETLQQMYPNFCNLHSIGKSVDGKYSVLPSFGDIKSCRDIFTIVYQFTK